jgi:hypothetical protein
MSASTAIVLSANSTAIAANSIAKEAERKACLGYVKGYTHDVATVEEMREYAGCVERIHPANFAGNDLLVVKIMILVVFAAIIGGVLYEKKNRGFMSEGWVGAIILGGAFGAATSACGLVVVWLIGAGIVTLMK